MPLVRLPHSSVLASRKSVYGAHQLDDLEQAMRARNLIRMIKALRAITDWGLKDAKDFVCWFFPDEGQQNILSFKNELREVYEIYGKTLWTPEELKLAEVKDYERAYAASKGPVKMTSDEAEAVKAPILLGIQSAVDHWQTMGFDSLYDACFMVLNNLEGKNRPKPPPPPPPIEQYVECPKRFEDEDPELGELLRKWCLLDRPTQKRKWNQPVVNETPKVGRNEPCPCGSGKKYKKCCEGK
jgi:hypothetical protein